MSGSELWSPCGTRRAHRPSSPVVLRPLALASLLLVLAVLASVPHRLRAQDAPAAQQILHTLRYAPGKSITLSLPKGLDIDVAASGIKRVRFFAMSPDGRVFATGLDSLADNTNGTIYILEGWDAAAHKFTRVTRYLGHLRNPNNLAFYAEPPQNGRPGAMWLYVPLTDRLLRFRYQPGDEAPRSAPEVLAKWPDYGLSYKYGGWHLTRTVAVATLHGETRVYVSLGSSCNYCEEHEVARAAVVSMRPDGSDPRLVAQGLRNAVDLRWIPQVDGGALFATNMGDDHLGDQRPEDTFFELDANSRPGPIAAATKGSVPHFGWPTCYFDHGAPVHDTTPLPGTADPGNIRTEAERPADAGPASHGVAPHQSPSPAGAGSKRAQDSVYGEQKGVAQAGVNLAAGGGHSQTVDPNAALGRPPAPLGECSHVPPAYTTFPAHSSPLGLAYFDASSPILGDSFVVALHGASHPHIGTGYRLVRFTPTDRTPRDLITGFLTGGPHAAKVHGRPCGLLVLGPDTFLITDDYLGLVYYVHPTPSRR